MNTQPTYGIARECNAGLPRVSARPRIASAVTPSDGPTAGRRPWRCWMVAAAVLVGAGWGSNQFAPMLLVHRHALGLSPGALEAMFGVYALGLIPGLLLTGPVSDARGRRMPRVYVGDPRLDRTDCTQ